MTTRTACDVLGCECRCHRAGRRRAPRLWTPDMDRRLTDAVGRGEHPLRIAAAMHLTEDSIKWRIKQLGLSLRDGWHSRQEAAVLLGVGRRAIDRWMREGHLVVERHGTRWTRITDASLRACVERRAGLDLDPRMIADRRLRSVAETHAHARRRAGA